MARAPAAHIVGFIPLQLHASTCTLTTWIESFRVSLTESHQRVLLPEAYLCRERLSNRPGPADSEGRPQSLAQAVLVTSSTPCQMKGFLGPAGGKKFLEELDLRSQTSLVQLDQDFVAVIADGETLAHGHPRSPANRNARARKGRPPSERRARIT